MKKKKGIETKFLVGILILTIIIVGVLFGLKFAKKLNSSEETSANGDATNTNQIARPEVVELKEVQIYKGNDRPIAIMIDNHDDARPQAGINKAYIVYEIVVEGGYTRLMPIFKGVEADKIGPVRSSRHYYLDYALENDAIYVHFGWSPQAEKDISKLKVNNINGITQSSSDFKRDKGKYAPHNVVTSTKNILGMADKKDYRTTSKETSVLKYSADPINLEKGIAAEDIYIPFSTSQNVSLKYDKEKQVYIKSANKKKQTDWATKEDITCKNIIITFADTVDLVDKERKGRQDLKNIGKKDGYYITNGKAIKITCEKTSRTEKTIYKDLDGKEIEVNDGNTYVAICPTDAEVTITAPDLATDIAN